MLVFIALAPVPARVLVPLGPYRQRCSCLSCRLSPMPMPLCVLPYFAMMALTNRIWASKVITFEYAIQPLNILKQALSMFMSIDTSDQLLNLEGLSKFLLDKDSQALPEKIRVFVYHTATKQVRNGWGMARTEKGFHTLGEITYPPFGLVYALDSEPTRNDFFEISDFKNYVFNQTVQARLTIPFLTPKTYIPGVYT